MLVVLLSFCRLPLGEGCEQAPNHYSWNDRSIQIIDNLESFMMVVLLIVMLTQRRARKRQALPTDPFALNTIVRFERQLSFIAVFYLGSSITDEVCIRLTFSGFQMQSLLCVDQHYMVSANNQGAAVLLLYTLVTCTYSLVMLFVFYYLPLKSGLALS
jgi:hypothetical protein